MKTRLTGATFDASEKTITHASFSDVTLAGIQLITNVTDQIIIYNFADTTKGGTLSTDTLTLEYDTTSMSDTDELMILVEDGSASTAINDGGNTITVDGTVSVTGVSTAANQTTIIGHLDGVEGLLTTIDADTGTIATEVAGLLTDTELRATPVPVSGTITANAGTNLNTSALALETTASSIKTAVETIDNAISGTEMQVDVLTMPTTTVTATNLDIRDLTSVSDSVSIGGTVAVTQSGTWDEVGINDSGNSITVDYATTGSGTATGALRVELPTNGTGVIATVGAVTAITNALPAGTNAIGKLAANSGVDIGDVTLTAGTAAIGTLLPPDIDVTAHTNYKKFYYTNAGAVTDGIVWSPAAGKRWHILWMVVNVSADATVTFEDDKAGGDEVVMKAEIAGKSGFPVTCSEKYPLASGEDAADLLITTTAGNVYVFGCGYEV